MLNTDNPNSQFCPVVRVGSERKSIWNCTCGEIHCLRFVSNLEDCFPKQILLFSLLTPMPLLGMISDCPSDTCSWSFLVLPILPAGTHLSISKELACVTSYPIHVPVSYSTNHLLWPQCHLCRVLECLPFSSRCCSTKGHSSSPGLSNVNLNWKCVRFTTINTETV